MRERLWNKNSYILMITVFRIWLSAKLPIWALGDAAFDDALGVNLAANIIQGRWLGEYTHLTLQKGVSFPLFLVIINKIGLSYNMAVILLWIVSIMMFCCALKPILSEKNRVILYTFLLFNPIMFDYHVVQRVYRSSLTLPVMLMIIGCYLWIYFEWFYKGKLSWKVALVAGICLAFFMNLRDDGVFLYPLILVISFIIIGIAYKRQKHMIKALAIIMLPFGILEGANMAVSAINYHYYGLFITTEPSHSAFREFRDLLYSIKNEEEIPCVSVTRKKLKRLYELSPTLKEFSSGLEDAMDFWAKCDRTPDDLEVEDGWIRWALRDGFNREGVYVDAVTADKTYKKIAEELQEAVLRGEVDTQKLLPIDVLPVWKNEYMKPLIGTMGRAFRMVVSYEKVSPVSWEGTGTREQLRLFEVLTNEKAIYPSTNQIQIDGWLALKVGDAQLRLKDTIDSEEYSLKWKGSEDVSAYIGEEKQFQNSRRCRFSESIQLNEKINNKLSLVVENNGDEFEIPINFEGEHLETDDYILHLDVFSQKKISDPYMTLVDSDVEMIRCLTDFFIIVLRIMAILGTLSFALLSFLVLRDFGQDKLFNSWLLAVACILTFVVLAVAESLLQITAFDALLSLYLAPGYILMMLFFLIPILALVDYWKKTVER